MKRPVLDLDRFVPGIIVMAANKLSRGSSAIYRTLFHISVNEWRIIALLELEPAVTANRICQVIGCDKALVSRSLQLLQQRGAIKLTLDPNDQRRKIIVLTKLGQDLHNRVLSIALNREKRLLEMFSDTEVDILIKLLKKLDAAIPSINSLDESIVNSYPKKMSAATLRRRRAKSRKKTPPGKQQPDAIKRSRR